MKRSNPVKKRAILSVAQKERIDDIASALDDNGYELYATENTAAAITSVSVTGSLWDLLGKFTAPHSTQLRETTAARLAELMDRGIDLDSDGPIDAVCIDLSYGSGHDVERPVHKDVGGLAMLGAANRRGLFVVSSPGQYLEVLEILAAGQQDVPDIRQELIAEARETTEAYTLDRAIANIPHLEYMAGL